jgi:hypothetical protein
MAGDRQLVRNAVAAYFGGTLVTADAGTCYQGGPLVSSGLGTAYPYQVKGVPDPYYFTGMPAGTQWGTVMGLRADRDTTRDSYGGATSGWRKRYYTITCELVVISQAPHVETAGAGLDDLIDAMHALIYADRTLGTTGGIYDSLANGRLIQQAGENPYGIKDSTPVWAPVKTGDEHSRWFGEGVLSFQALTMVAA